jgi:hypothetical protein
MEASGFIVKRGKNKQRCSTTSDNFGMNTGYGRYGATYNMVGFSCFNEELLCV